MKKSATFLAAAVLIFLCSACSPQSVGADSASLITVSLNGIKVGEISPAEIAALPSVTIRVDDTVRQGPTLAAVLDKIGIVSYMAVTASGYSRNHAEAVIKELDEMDLAGDIIFTVDGSAVAIFGFNVPSEFWDMTIANLAVISCECGFK